MTLRIGVDVDGVLADFRTMFRETARDFWSENRDASADASPADALSAADLQLAWKEVSTCENWWTRLRPFEPDQIERLYTNARRLKWEVFFLTKRPGTIGDSVQFQTQWWLEQYGFYLPSVLTVLGSRGEIANALHLDIVVDDQQMNCIEVISASATKALLMLRDRAASAERDRATGRGIGVVATLQEAIDVFERLHEILPGRRGRLVRLVDWFPGAKKDEPHLPMDPRTPHPIPNPLKSPK